jgi:hypothetical protein
MIDHRRTSRGHPQADDLAERMVQTIKKALQKYCLVHNKHHWRPVSPLDCYGIPHELPSLPGRLKVCELREACKKVAGLRETYDAAIMGQ